VPGSCLLKEVYKKMQNFVMNELSKSIGKEVEVTTSNNKRHVGILIDFDKVGNLIIEDHVNFNRIFIRANQVGYIQILN
jgi:small nuclear ribonucleoprotein (snRNP)-like protein